jgi:hypothetical protein
MHLIRGESWLSPTRVQEETQARTARPLPSTEAKGAVVITIPVRLSSRCPNQVASACQARGRT